jgi:hypothetical protein
MAGSGGASMPSVFIHFLENKRRGSSVKEGKEDNDDSASFLHGAGKQTVAQCG